MVATCLGRQVVGKLKIKESVKYGAWNIVLVLHLDEKTVGEGQVRNQRQW